MDECVQHGGRTGRRNVVLSLDIRSYVLTSFPGMHSIAYMVDCCVNISNDPNTSRILFGSTESNQLEEDRRTRYGTHHTRIPYLFNYVGVVAIN